MARPATRRRLALAAAALLLPAIAAGLIRLATPPDPPADAPPPALPAATAAAPATTAAAGVARRLPGEFERQDALLLGCAQMVQYHPKLLTDIVAACHDRVRVMCLVGFAEERLAVADLLRNRGLSRNIELMMAPLVTMWVRDYGPLSVLDAVGRAQLVDADYEANLWNKADDAVPASLARTLRLPLRHLPLIMEGGDLLSNGRGLCLTSRRLIDRNTSPGGLDTPAVGRLLREHLGVEEWYAVPSLVGEPTGHVDMFAAFADPTTLVLGRYDPGTDPVNAVLLDRIAEQMVGLDTAAGALRIERMPMPPHDDGRWRTYTNVIFANGRLVVPTYPDRCPDRDREALATWQHLLPDWEVVAVDASDLVRKHGALHCVTLNVPDLAEGPPAEEPARSPDPWAGPGPEARGMATD